MKGNKISYSSPIVSPSMSKIMDIMHGKIALPFWGSLSEIERGWQLCDGTNGTPDLRKQFIRGASNDTELGTTVGHSTALPQNNFVTEEKTATLGTYLTGENNVDHTHYHNHPAENMTTDDTAFSDRQLVYCTGPIYEDEITKDTSGDNGVFNESGDWFRTDYEHNHSITVNIDGITSNTQSDNHKHNMSHSHSVGEQAVVDGGDSETAPDHIFVYWITYTGELSPNW